MQTFAQLKAKINGNIWPNDAPENLIGSVEGVIGGPIGSYYVAALIDLQSRITCMQVRNVSVFPQCSTMYRCGTTVLDAPRGRILRVRTVRGDYCDPVKYHQKPYDELIAWTRSWNRLLTSPANTGMSPLPDGFRYPDATTDNEWGRALTGIWAIESRRIFVAPWIQSDEKVIVEFDGIKREWSEEDLIVSDVDVQRAIDLYVRKEFARDFERDPNQKIMLEQDYKDARADLIHECDEENRVRKVFSTGDELESSFSNYIESDVASLVPAVSEGTAPSETASLVFAVIGDYGSDSTTEADVAALVKSWNPEFVVTTGDNNYPDGAAATIDANVGKHYRKFIYPYVGSQSLQSGEADPAANKFFPVLGNHDLDTVVGGVPAKPYFDYFKLPNNERYYDVVFGDLHLFFINSGLNTAGTLVETDGNTSLSLQGEWIRNRIARSTSKWKGVIGHHPPHTSSSSYHPGFPDLEWDWPNKGVDFHLSGHGHNYERIMSGTFPYFVNGAGGKDLVGFFGTPVDGSTIRYSDDFGAMRVTCTCSSVKLEFITRTGIVVDTLTLTK